MGIGGVRCGGGRRGERIRREVRKRGGEERRGELLLLLQQSRPLTSEPYGNGILSHTPIRRSTVAFKR